MVLCEWQYCDCREHLRSLNAHNVPPAHPPRPNLKHRVATCLALNMRLRAHAYSSSISICCHFLPLHFPGTKSHTRREPGPENPGSAKGCTSIQKVFTRRWPECPVRHVGNKKIILIGRTRKNEPHETATAGGNADGLCRLRVSGWTGIPGKFTGNTYNIGNTFSALDTSYLAAAGGVLSLAGTGTWTRMLLLACV